jgi:hypothetical protein
MRIMTRTIERWADRMVSAVVPKARARAEYAEYKCSYCGNPYVGTWCVRVCGSWGCTSWGCQGCGTCSL